jgi:hypothetical protein
MSCPLVVHGRWSGGRRVGRPVLGAEAWLTGPDGLLGQLTERVLESALKGEITDHLGLTALRISAGCDGGE